MTNRPPSLSQALRGFDPSIPGFTSVKRPTINLEAIYDYGFNPLDPVPVHYNRFRARQAGYLSWLAGATGYSFGASGIWEWGLCNDNPPDGGVPDWCTTGAPEAQNGFENFSDAMNADSSRDIARMGEGLRGLLIGQLVTNEQQRILNQSSSADKRMVVAREPDRFVAYLPENNAIEIDFDRPPALAFGPLSFWWSPRWNENPSTREAPGELIEGETNAYRYSNPHPQGTGPGQYDYGLVIYRDNWPNLLGGGGSTSDNTVDFSLRPRTGGSQILLQARHPDGSPAGPSYVLLNSVNTFPPVPIGGRDASNRFVVLWNEVSQSTGVRTVFLRRLGSTGAPQGAATAVASSTAIRPDTPWVALVPGGDSVVAWVERDGATGESTIWMRKIPLFGVWPAAEPVVTAEEGWIVRFPQVACGPGGDCLLAWTAENTTTGGIEIWRRAFGLDSLYAGTSFLTDAEPAADKWLTVLTNDANGEFELHWQEFPEDPAGATMVYAMSFDSLGNVISGRQEDPGP